MKFLSDKERDVLHAFCDTIHPRVAPPGGGDSTAASASDLGVTALVEHAMETKSERSRERLRLLLRLLERRAVNGMLAGHWAPFTQLSVCLLYTSDAADE